MLPIAILLNKKAGKGQGLKICKEVTSILDHREMEYAVFTNDWPIEYGSFSSVWIIGGDGTLNYFVNHAVDPVPPISIFKGGTGNDFATHLYGKANTAEMVDIILSAEPRSIDAGKCNGNFFLNMAGIGFDGDVLKKMGTIRWLGAFLGYYVAIIQSVIFYKEPFFRISINEGPFFHQPLLLLLINNASTTGGGFRVSPTSDLRDGKLELMTCAPLSVFKRLIALPRVRKGKHLDLPYIKSQQVTRVHVSSSTPLFAQIDGDLIEALQFDISILPGHFRFLY